MARFAPNFCDGHAVAAQNESRDLISTVSFTANPSFLIVDARSTARPVQYFYKEDDSGLKWCHTLQRGRLRNQVPISLTRCSELSLCWRQRDFGRSFGHYCRSSSSSSETGRPDSESAVPSEPGWAAWALELPVVLQRDHRHK